MPKLDEIGKAALDVEQPSGIAYHPGLRKLLVVSDALPQLFVVDPSTGAVDDAIDFDDGDHDREGIAVRSGGAELLVVEERAREVLRYDMRGHALGVVPVPVTGDENSGLEGITVDPHSGRVFVLHEKNPRAMLELDSALALQAVHGVAGLDDLSGLCFDDGGLWVVSDESKRLARYELRPDGLRHIGAWGLGRRRAEGVIVLDDALYVVFDDEGTNLRWYARPST